jgi:putative phage-type endonuclease
VRTMALPGDLPTVAIPLLPPVRSKRDRARWLAERHRYICASDVAAILGVPGAYKSAFALWWQKTQGWASDEQAEEQEWGHRLEDAVARKFAENHPELKVRKPPASLWASDKHDWMACTPDRLATHAGYLSDLRPVELKTDQNQRRWGEEPPDLYRVQLLWQCAVLQGLPYLDGDTWCGGPYRGHLAALVGKRYHEYDLEFAPGEIADTIDAVRPFHESLLAGVPPEVDGHASTTEALELLYADYDPDEVAVVDAALAVRYVERRTRAAVAKAELREVENELRAAMGRAGTAIAPSGRTIARRSVFKRMGYSVAPAEVDRLNYVPTREGGA